MKSLSVVRRLGLLGLLAATLSFLPAVTAQPELQPFDPRDRPGPPPAVPDDKDAPEVQGRGPVHEGFAQPSDAPRPGPVAPKAPPDPVPEQPPEERPEGENVVWLSGYWAFDEDRGDFLWISGFWRVAPAGRKWVPGYWNRADAGWQWVGGFWAPEGEQEAPYVTEPPPDTIDRGPSVPAPADDYQYVPGNWVHRETRYVWSPGYWHRPRLGFVWCPPRWCWTPRGYLFVSGFSDCDFEHRGVLYAPVYFPRPLWARRGWYYRPTYVVPPTFLVGSLWVRPRGGYYAYGDFYGVAYSRAGYQPWAIYGARSRDPLFGYYRWANRNDPRWQQNLVTAYQDRARGDAPLPPRTLAAQQRLLAQRRDVPTNLVAAQTLNQVTINNKNVRVTKVSQAERVTAERYVESVRKSSVDRRAEESRVLKRDERPAPLSLNKVPPTQPKQTPKFEPFRDGPKVPRNPTPPPKGDAPKVPLNQPKGDAPKVPLNQPKGNPPPKADAPKVPLNLPKGDAPKVPLNQPKFNPPPKGDAPKVPLNQPKGNPPPKADLPKVPLNLPKGDAPKVPLNQPKGNPPPVSTPKVEAPKFTAPPSQPKVPLNLPKGDAPKVPLNQPKFTPPPSQPKVTNFTPPPSQPKGQSFTPRSSPPPSQPARSGQAKKR